MAGEAGREETGRVARTKASAVMDLTRSGIGAPRRGVRERRRGGGVREGGRERKRRGGREGGEREKKSGGGGGGGGGVNCRMGVKSMPSKCQIEYSENYVGEDVLFTMQMSMRCERIRASDLCSSNQCLCWIRSCHKTGRS